jgi:hypothetical protein
MKFINRGNAIKKTGFAYLGKCGSSSKIIKSAKVLNIDTYILYLAPSNASGYNVCPMATKECIAGCLNTSGRAGIEILSGNKSRIINARIKKTQMFFKNREFFMNWLICDIAANKILSQSKGNEFAVRLNGTSDINWMAYKINGKNVFETFPEIQFYDYTKVVNRFTNKPDNYHLTFSYTGYNWNDCEMVLNSGNNIAVIFNVGKNKPLPLTYNGYIVIDGDITDYRPFDPNGVIVGLHWKQIANKKDNMTIKNSVFVVQSDDVNCTYYKPELNLIETF